MFVAWPRSFGPVTAKTTLTTPRSTTRTMRRISGWSVRTSLRNEAPKLFGFVAGVIAKAIGPPPPGPPGRPPGPPGPPGLMSASRDLRGGELRLDDLAVGRAGGHQLR